MGIFDKLKIKKNGTEIIDYTKGEQLTKIKPKQNFKFSGDFVDLRKQSQSPVSQNPPDSDSKKSSSIFGFLDSFSSSSLSQNGKTLSPEDLGKNLQNLSRRLEDASNEIYHLIQRIELLERKIDRLEGKTQTNLG